MSEKKERYKIVRKIHKGRSNICIAKRKSDGELLIWKQPKSQSQARRESFRGQIKRSKYWRKFGVSKVKIWWHSDGVSLLKTYIDGPTLSKMLEKRHNFFSQTKKRPVKALIKFVKNLADSEHYIHDMKGANIVYDGKNWQVIDSGPVYKMSPSKTRKEYKKMLLEKWSRSLHSESEIKSLKSFLKEYI